MINILFITCLTFEQIASIIVLQDKANIRKELNDYKSAEMDVHDDSRHLTRCIFCCNPFGGSFFLLRNYRFPKEATSTTALNVS